MNSNSPRPEDFIIDYSPIQPADLLLWIIYEYPQPGIKGFPKRIRTALHHWLYKEKDNDELAQEVISAILQQKGEISGSSVADYFEKRFEKIDHLRKFEYPFLAQCLSDPSIQKSTIVDIGGGLSFSTVVPMLFRFPDTKILSVDVVHHSRSSTFNVEYVQGNCIQTGLPGLAVDFAIAISTLEHIGLGRYSDPMDVNGDLKAMAEIRRILKPGGYVVLTVPYGYPTVVFNLNRIYDQGRLGLLCQGFKIVKEQYSLYGQIVDKTRLVNIRAEKNIPGYTDSIHVSKRFPNTPGGVMLLLKKSA